MNQGYRLVDQSSKYSSRVHTGGLYGEGWIEGVPIIQVGRAIGHQFSIDEITVKQCYELAMSSGSLPAPYRRRGERTPHDNYPLLEREFARLSNFTCNGKVLRGDLHFIKEGHNIQIDGLSQPLDVIELVKSKVSRAPQEFGLSIEAPIAYIEEVNGENFLRVKKLRAGGLVDSPAATVGLLGENKIMDELSSQLQKVMEELAKLLATIQAEKPVEEAKAEVPPSEEEKAELPETSTDGVLTITSEKEEEMAKSCADGNEGGDPNLTKTELPQEAETALQQEMEPGVKTEVKTSEEEMALKALMADYTPEQQTCISEKISILEEEGMERDQAIAIAIKYCTPEKSTMEEPTEPVEQSALSEKDTQFAEMLGKIMGMEAKQNIELAEKQAKVEFLKRGIIPEEAYLQALIKRGPQAVEVALQTIDKMGIIKSMPSSFPQDVKINNDTSGLPSIVERYKALGLQSYELAQREYSRILSDPSVYSDVDINSYFPKVMERHGVSL